MSEYTRAMSNCNGPRNIVQLHPQKRRKKVQIQRQPTCLPLVSHSRETRTILHAFKSEPPRLLSHIKAESIFMNRIINSIEKLAKNFRLNAFLSHSLFFAMSLSFSLWMQTNATDFDDQFTEYILNLDY